MRMATGENRAQLAGGAPGIAHRVVTREVELFGQRLEIAE
jgi:hypothetical protein